MHTTMFTYYDLFLAKVRALPQCKPTASPPCVVFDGVPGPHRPNLYVSIGWQGGEGEPVAAVERWAQLGGQARWEKYGVRCMIWSWKGGTDNTATTADDAQAEARNNAIVVFNAIADALWADINFSVANGGTQLVQFSGITDITVRHTPNHGAGDDGSKGRSCAIDFTVDVEARLQRLP